MTERETTTFRFTAEGKALLRALAKKMGISMAGVVELLLREEASRRGVSAVADGERPPPRLHL